MSAEKRERLMGKTMELLKLDPEGETSYDDAHEYLAEIFEHKTYKPTTLIGQMLHWIKNLFSKFRRHREEIANMLTQIDEGEYRDVPPDFPSYIDDQVFGKVKDTVDNEFNSDRVERKKAELFGDQEYINWWAQKNIMPIIYNFSNLGKTISLSVDVDINMPNFEFAAKSAYETILGNNEYYKEAFGPDNEDGDTIEYYRLGETKPTSKYYGELTQTDIY